MKEFELQSAAPPWVVFTSDTAGLRAWLAEAGQGHVTYLDGRSMSGPTSTFIEMSRALQFPSYFGHNWDALEECLGDINAWLPSVFALVVIENADHLVTAQHLPMMVRVLCAGSERAAATEDEDGMPLDRRPMALHFIFLLDDQHLKETRVRLSKIGRNAVAAESSLAFS